MATNQEILNLVLQFETIFKGKNEFTTFVTNNVSALKSFEGQFDSTSDKIKTLLNTIALAGEKLGNLNGKKAADELRQLANVPAVAQLLEKTKELNQAVTALQEGFKKGIDITSITTAASKIQKAFFPEAKKETNYGKVFVDNFKEQIQKFSSGDISLDKFLSDLIPKEGLPTRNIEKILKQANTFVSELKTIVGNINVDSTTTEGRASVLDAIAKRLLGGTEALNTAKERVTVSSTELSKVIENLVKVASLSIQFGIEPPKDLFSKFPEAFRTQGVEQTGLLRGVIAKIYADADASNIKVDKVNFSTVLKQMGFDEADIKTQFNIAADAIAKSIAKLQKELDNAVQLKTNNLGTDRDVRERVTKLQEDLGKFFNKGLFQNLGNTFETEFNTALNALKVFETGSTQSLKQFQDFETGIKKLKESLSGMPATSEVAKALLSLLEAYHTVEKEFRLGSLLSSQTASLNAFKKRVDELKDTIGRSAPQEKQFTFTSNADAGIQALKEKEEALAKFGSLANSTALQINELKNKIAELQTIQKLPEFAGQQDAIQKTINDYGKLQKTLEAQQTSLAQQQEAWTRNWEKKTADVKRAEASVAKFNETLNTTTVASEISNALHYAKAFAQIGVASDEAKLALQGVFAQFGQFGGISKSSIQAMEEFQRAINTLFASRGTGKDAVTLIDLSNLPSQTQGSAKALELLGEQLLKLTGTSAEAKEQFRQLAFANEFLQKTGQGGTAFGQQIAELYKIAQAVQLYVVTLDVLKQRQESYVENLTRVKSAQIEVTAAFEVLQKAQAQGKDTAPAVAQLEVAYKNYAKQLEAAEARLKQLENTKKDLQSQQTTLGFSPAVSELTLLESAINSTKQRIDILKNTVSSLGGNQGDKTSLLFQGIVNGVNKGNEEIQTALSKLQVQAVSKLAGITESFQNKLAQTKLGGELAKNLEGELEGLAKAFKSANLAEVLVAIDAIKAKIQQSFTVQGKTSTEAQELANTYLKPYQELLRGLESIAIDLAKAMPKLVKDTTQQTAVADQLATIRQEIKSTSNVLDSFGKTANTAQLSARFEEAKLKAQALNAEISQLSKGSFDQAKYNDFELRLQGINNQYKAISKENESFGAGLRINELNNLIDTASRSLKDFGKSTNIQALTDKVTALQAKFPELANSVSNVSGLLKEAFEKNKTIIDIKPFEALQRLLNTQNTAGLATDELNKFNALKAAIAQTINDVNLYNSIVKTGSTRSAGVGAIINRADTDQTIQALEQVDKATSAASLQLQRLASTNGITALSAKQLVTEFKAAENTFESLGTKAGGLTGTSENLAKVLRSLSTVKGAEALVQFIQQLKNDINQAIKSKEQLDKQFASGFTQKLEQDLDRLARAKELLNQFGSIASGFQKQDYFAATSYGARQTYEELQRLEKEMRTVRTALEGSLSVGRANTLDPTLKTQLEAQEQELTKNIAKITQYRAVYDQLRSQVKIEEFERLKTILSEVFSTGNINSLRQYTDSWKSLSTDVRGSIASITTATEPLTQTIIDNFKKQSDAVKDNLTAWRNYANILRTIQSSLPAGQSSIQLPNGSNLNVERTIKLLDLLIASAEKVSPAISIASTSLETRLGTATGQAEVRVSNLINKFGDLQARISNLNPGSSINDMYGSVKELMELLNRPYKSGPFFTLPKESFAPIRNEILGLLETAKQLQNALSFNLDKLTSGTTKFKETEAAIKAAKDEVERLSAAMQRLSEYEKNASHFSTLRSGLHGAATNLSELAHEGAFIYKGLDALFKNIAKNIAPKISFDGSQVDAELKRLNTQFNLSSTTADAFGKKVKEVLNAQIGGGGLAAAREYGKAFQQLEEAFVKFRSGLTQAAMGFQMFGDALLEPFKKAKERFEEFSDTMGVVNAVTNATQAQFKALTDQALLMGATTRFTAEQAAEGLKALAKAGFTAEEQIATLPAVMRLAQAAATDLATAASISTVVMKEFRMDPEQFNEAADKITLAANRTLGTVEDLGFAFKYVGALAANIGADFGDLTAAIGLLQNAGLKGTLAGTALRGMLMALYNPTRDETKLIAELGERIGGLGLQISDASGKFVGYGKIVKQLEQAGITTGEVLRFFGQRAGPGMAALLAQGSEALQNLEGDLRNAEGTTAHMAEIMEQTLKGRLLLMRSAFEALSDSIGHNLAPTLAGAADIMADFVSRFVALRQEFDGVASFADHLLSGLALIASVLGGLAVTFAFIIVPVKQFLGFLKTLIVTTWAGSAAIGSLSAAAAFNAAVINRTGIAFERAMRAQLTLMGVTAANATATQLHAAVTAIDVKALQAQALAYETATAAAIKHGTATVGFWAGLKGVLSIIGGLLRGLLGWWGLALGAVAAIVAITLTHSKSVAQTNVELDKQNQLIEYSRKNAVRLNETLANTSEELRRNEQALKDLRSGKSLEFNLLQPNDTTQTTEAKLQLDIEKNKKDLQNQLKQLLTQITESEFLKKSLVIDASFDKEGNFDKFKVKAKDLNEEINVLENGYSGMASQANRVTAAVERLSFAQQKYNTELEITNIVTEKFANTDTNSIDFIFESFSTTFEKTEGKIKGLSTRLLALQSVLQKVKTGKPLTEKDMIDADLGLIFQFSGLDNKTKILEDSINSTTNDITALVIEQEKTLGVVTKGFVDRLETLLQRSQTEIATAANRYDLLKTVVDSVAKKGNLSTESAKLLLDKVDQYFETIKNGLTTEQIVGENLRKPATALVGVTKDLVTYLEAANKELKTKIDEQKKIFDEAKVVVDAVKAYQTAITEAAKDTLNLRNQEIEFDAKIKLENLDQNFEQQLSDLEAKNQIVELPFKAKLITDATDTSDFKALSSLSGLLLNYERKNTAELIQLQIKHSQDQVDVKNEELNKKQQLAENFLKLSEHLYNVDTIAYAKAQQEQAKGVQEALNARYEAVQNHLKNLLKLHQDNTKAIIDLEKQKKQFEASIEQTRVNFGTAQLLPTEQFARAKQDLDAIDIKLNDAITAKNWDGAVAFLQERQKLVDQIATSVGAQPELTLKVANLDEKLKFDLDRIDFEKEFNKANIRITTGAKGLSEALSSGFTKPDLLSSSFVPQLENGNVDIRKALQTTEKLFSFEAIQTKLERFGGIYDGTIKDLFKAQPTGNWTGFVDELQANINQVTQARDALNEVTIGKPGIPLLNNLSETGEKSLLTLRNVKGELITLSAQSKVKALEGIPEDLQDARIQLTNLKGEFIALGSESIKIKPLEGLTTDIQKGQEALVGFKSLIDTQIEDLSRGDKVVELPISFKTDFNAFDTASLDKYSAEVLSYEKNLNKEVLNLQLKRIDASLVQEQKAAEQKRTIVTNQITTIETLYDKQLGDMQNWSKQDLDAYKSNIESKKSSLISFLQEELSATQSTYNELFQIRANLLNKNKALDEQFISFQANATKNFQTIDDLGKSDSQKTYETRLKSLNLQADADAALAQGDYDRAKALLEQRQQLIDAAVSSLKPEDTIGKFFLKQDQTEAVASYKKVTDALKLQNQNAVKDVEAQLNSVNGQIAALKQSADTAKAALQELLNKLFEISNKKFKADVEFVSKQTQNSADTGKRVFTGGKDQLLEQQNTLNDSIKITQAELQTISKTYKEQGALIEDLITLVKDKQLLKIGVDDQSYKDLLDYAIFYESMIEQLNREGLEIQVKKTGLAELKKQYEELLKLKKLREDYAKTEESLKKATESQAQFTALVGYANTITTAVGNAKELQKIFTTLKGKELGAEDQTKVKDVIETLRKSAQALREDFNKSLNIDDQTKTRLEGVIALLQKDPTGLKGDELKAHIRDVTQALSDLENQKRTADSAVAEKAKDAIYSNIDVLQIALSELQKREKDNKLTVDVKDTSLREMRKKFEDALSEVEATIGAVKDPKQIAALAPVKDLLEKMNAITKGNLSDEEKITQLLNVRNVALQKAVDLTEEEKEQRRVTADFLDRILGNQPGYVTALNAAAKNSKSIAASTEDMTKQWQAWLEATPDEQVNILNAINDQINKIKETGLSVVKPGDEKAASELFTKLTQAQEKFAQAQNKLGSAFTSGDATAINKAIQGIKDVGIELSKSESLSKEARQEFAKLADLPSLDIALRFNTKTVIPEVKQALAEVQDQAQQRTPINMEWSEVLLAVEKLKVVESEVTKLRGLSAVEFKGYTTVDVEKSQAKLVEFAQRIKELLEIPVETRGEDFKAKLRDLFVEYEQFRSQLQPVMIEGDTKNLDTEVYQKIIRILQEAKTLSQEIGNDKTAEEYNVLLNKIVQAKGKISSDKLSIQMEGHQELKQLIEDTAALRNELSQSEKDSIIVKATMIGREDVTSGLTSIENAIDRAKNKTRFLNDVLAEVRGKLAETATVPGLETPAAAFDELNNKLTDTRTRLKEAFESKNLNEASLEAFKNNIQNLIDKMSQVKGVSSDMVNALRAALDVELKDYTLKVKPEVLPVEKRAAPIPVELAPEPVKIPPPPPVPVTTVSFKPPEVPKITETSEVPLTATEPPKVPEVPPLPPIDQTVNLQIPPVPQVPPQTMIVNPALQPVPALPLMYVDVTPKFVTTLPALSPVDVYVNPVLQEIKKPSNIWVDVEPKLQPIQKPANIEVDVDPKLQEIKAPETTVLLKPKEDWAAEITNPEKTVILSPEKVWDEKITPPEKTVTLNPEPGWESKIVPPTVTPILQPVWNMEEIPQPSVVATVTALVDQAVSGIGQVMEMLSNLPSSKRIDVNVHTRYTSSGDSSSAPSQDKNQGGLIGSLQYFADGGLAKFKELASAFVPGSGNTDTVPVMLTPGEYVIKKERVKELGINFLNSLNKGLIQFKSMGGMVYNSPINTLNKMSGYIQPKVQMPQETQTAGGPPIDINLTIKDKTFNIKTPRSEAGKLVSALQYLERGIK